MKSEQFLTVLRLLLLQLLFSIVLSGSAAADSRLKDLSADEREKLIRESIFAADNPEHSISANLQNPAGVQIPAGQFGDQGSGTSPGQPNAGLPSGSRGRQYSQQHNYQRRPPSPSYYNRPNGPESDTAVELNENGSVHVDTGNNSIDRSVESFIDKKVRSAQSVFRNLWR